VNRISSTIAFVLAVTLIAANAFAKGPPPPPAPTELNPAWGTLFIEDKALELTKQCSRASPGPVFGVWTPTPIQIQQMEVSLYPLIADQLRQRNPQDKTWRASDYYRQYGGLSINGQRIIYVNGIHRSVIERANTGDKWKTTAVGICDGGELAFGVEYDPISRNFDKFLFNGKL
jgi:hypothetical protein